MEIKRSQSWAMFDNNWCAKCGCQKDMKHINTNLPGIMAHECPDCGLNHQANFLEYEDDMMDFPEGFILMPSAK